METLLLKIQPQDNQYRFYSVQVLPGLFENWAVCREWGRIGQPGTVRNTWYATRDMAEEAAEKLCQRKALKGYRTEF